MNPAGYCGKKDPQHAGTKNSRQGPGICYRWTSTTKGRFRQWICLDLQDHYFPSFQILQPLKSVMRRTTSHTLTPPLSGASMNAVIGYSEGLSLKKCEYPTTAMRPSAWWRIGLMSAQGNPGIYGPGKTLWQGSKPDQYNNRFSRLNGLVQFVITIRI